MTKEQIKILFDYLKSTQNNVDRLLTERDQDQQDLKKKWEDVMQSLSSIATRLQTLEHAVENNTKKSQSEVQEAVSAVEGVKDVILTEMAFKTKIIEKTVEHVGLLKWLFKPLRKKVK